MASMVVGNLGLDGGMEKAKEWVENQIAAISKVPVLDTYAKGDYRGMLFCKFDSQHTRDICVSKMRNASPQRLGNRTYFSEDQPIEVRAIYS
eukprot:6667874-Karenia_brevis.AAC.1